MKNLSDLAPLMRETIGFDRLIDAAERALSTQSAQIGYPPFNIEKTGDEEYRLTVAAAGFSPDELNVETRDGCVVISGRKETGVKTKAGEEAKSAKPRAFLHRGIAERPFERTFQLAEHVKVKNASYEHGLLNVDLAIEVPEALKPKTIKIKSPK